MRVAVVDLGTNSTRLLVAEVIGGRVSELERRSTVTRLGRGVEANGTLSDEGVEAVCETVAGYVELYEGLEAERVTALATSAVRDAANGEQFVGKLRERFGLEARVLDGDSEARLTYLGAVSGRPTPEPTLVIDIGGGSTELVVGRDDEMRHHTSLQVGTIRHTERHLTDDPPAPDQLEALVADVRGEIEGAIARWSDVREGIAVAGTPTALAAIDLGLAEYDPELVHGHRLGLGTIRELLARLAEMPLERRLEVPGLPAGRAATIVAGTAILVEALDAFGLDEVEVSEHDILYGAALTAANPVKSTELKSP